MTAMRAVVSHPSKQGNMYRVPAGAAASGIPTDFLTGFYYKPDRLPWPLLRLLPPTLRRRVEEKLERRRLAEMDEALVTQVSGPLPELFYGWLKSYRQGNALHDRLAARWMNRHVVLGSTGVFHGFQESCFRSLAAARTRGLTALLESTLPPSTLPLVAAEYRRLDLPWPGATQPSAELLAELPRADFHIAQSAFAERSLIDYGVEPGRIIYEALAAGLPCIVSANAGSAVRDGIEGFVVPVGDIEALAARLRQLAVDEDLRRRMGLAARARAEQFAWPAFYRRIGIMYREAVAREGRPASGPVDLFDR